MFRAFVRWLKARRDAPAASVPAGTPAPAVPLPVSAAPSAAAAFPATLAVAPVMAIGARRPLIDARGRVAGFEFRIADATLRRLQGRDSEVAAAAHTRALFATMRLTAEAGRLAFTELPPAWLRRQQLADEVTAGCMIAVPLVEAADAFDAESCTAIRALRRAGARVGWAGPRVQPVTPDFIVVRPALDDLAAARQRGLPLLANDIDSVEELEAALRAGAVYACCSVAQRSEPKDAQPIAPQVQRLCQLLNRLVQEVDTAAIVADIKADVGVAYRLLHHLNMAGVGAGREIDSIEQAVALLGRNELYRWLSMVLIRFAAVRPASSALQEMALARARLFELLAIERHETAPGSLFTFGLASMLGLLLNVRLAEAIEPLNLPDLARQALLHGTGPWQPYLVLAVELQKPKSSMLEALAEPFGGLDKVLARSADAWHWAAKASEPAHSDAAPA